MVKSVFRQDIKFWHKKIAVVLIGLWLTVNIFPAVLVNAQTDSKNIYYADQDYITVKVDQGQNNYLLSIDSKNLGALDWTGYVFPLKTEDFPSPEDFQQKVKNNRSLYPDETKPIGLIYAPAKSLFRYLDVLSVVIDYAADKIFGGAIIDTVSVPADQAAIYLVRAYSGSWGKLNDPGEKAFVREQLTNGKARDDAALSLNIFDVVLDAASLIIPFDKSLSPDDLQKIGTAGLTEVSRKLSQPDFLQGGANLTDLYQVAVSGSSAMLNEFINLLTDQAAKNFVRFITKNSQLAVGFVNLSDKISKGGKIADRLAQLLTLATPLETSYFTVNGAEAKLAKAEVKPSGKVIKNWQLVSGDPADLGTHLIYKGEAQVRGWYELSTYCYGCTDAEMLDEKNFTKEWLLHIADEDIKYLPLYELTLKDKSSLNSVVKLEDASPELENKLKQATKDNPEVVTLRGYETYSEGEPGVSTQFQQTELLNNGELGFSIEIPKHWTKVNSNYTDSGFPSFKIVQERQGIYRLGAGGSEDFSVFAADNPGSLSVEEFISQKEGRNMSRQYCANTVYSGHNGMKCLFTDQVKGDKIYYLFFPINKKIILFYCSTIFKADPVCDEAFKTLVIH